MEINQTKQVKVNVKTLKIYIKICDQFTATLEDEQGEDIFVWDNEYVPGFMPGEHGDYLILDIDIDTGIITNWIKPTAEHIERAITKEED